MDAVLSCTLAQDGLYPRPTRSTALASALAPSLASALVSALGPPIVRQHFSFHRLRRVLVDVDMAPTAVSASRAGSRVDAVAMLSLTLAEDSQVLEMSAHV